MYKFLWALLLIAFVAFIFFNSSMPGAESQKASQLITSLILNFSNWLGFELPHENLEYNVRKVAHFIEFAILGLLLCNLYQAWNISRKTSAGYILFIGLAVGVVDEYIQLNVIGRSGQVTDVMLDFAGVFLIWFTREIWLWAKR